MRKVFIRLRWGAERQVPLRKRCFRTVPCRERGRKRLKVSIRLSETKKGRCDASGQTDKTVCIVRYDPKEEVLLLSRTKGKITECFRRLTEFRVFQAFSELYGGVWAADRQTARCC